MLKTIYEAKDSKDSNYDDYATLFELFRNMFEKNNNIKNTFNIELTNEMTIFIQTIISYHPSIFHNIETTINKIVVDNKIDTKDIPELLILIGTLYETLYKSNKINIKSAYFDIIKTLLLLSFSLLINNNVSNNAPNNDMIENIVKIIDAAIELIKLKRTIKPKFKLC